MNEEDDAYEETAHEAVELANRLFNQKPEANLWDIADGLLAGAVHYWLYSRQPCNDPMCADCASINTNEERLAELLRLTEQLAEESDYFHAPHDTNIGRA